MPGNRGERVKSLVRPSRSSAHLQNLPHKRATLSQVRRGPRIIVTPATPPRTAPLPDAMSYPLDPPGEHHAANLLPAARRYTAPRTGHIPTPRHLTAERYFVFGWARTPATRARTSARADDRTEDKMELIVRGQPRTTSDAPDDGGWARKSAVSDATTRRQTKQKCDTCHSRVLLNTRVQRGE
jgi:hypothetical protein